MYVEMGNLTYLESRKVEEALILKYSTLNRGCYKNNQIHSISSKRENYHQWVQEGYSLIRDETYVGGCEW